VPQHEYFGILRRRRPRKQSQPGEDLE
jgi:hypothetical protein